VIACCYDAKEIKIGYGAICKGLITLLGRMSSDPAPTIMTFCEYGTRVRLGVVRFNLMLSLCSIPNFDASSPRVMWTHHCLARQRLTINSGTSLSSIPTTVGITARHKFSFSGAYVEPVAALHGICDDGCPTHNLWQRFAA
jgi:hypothetical protein